MGVAVQQAESLSLDEIESFLDGCGSVEFQAGSRADKYALIEGVLRKHHYADQKRSVKGLLRRFLGKLTGLSRAQLTRLIGQFLREKCVRPTAYRRCRFPTKYSRADIVLLAHVDQVHQRLSGPATRRILQREFHVYGRKEFERLAELSVGHLYNLRKRSVYRRHSLHLDKTRSTPVAIGERRQPEPRGRPGYLRIDTVHSPEQEGEKGAYTINVVDEVTQWQVVGCVERISENYLIPLLEGLLAQFPFSVRGFHSDNGSEYINHQTAKLLEKLRIEFTKSRARRSNDNALVETKNGAVVRKWMGYQFLPSDATRNIDEFYREWLNPYLNFHRPCAFSSERQDRRGKLRKVYAEWSTPWEKLLSLPEDKRGLRGDRTIDALQAQVDAHSDTQFAEQLDARRNEVQRVCKDLAIRWRAR
jgi:transposase InsO family protein